ncbi:MAG: ABC transporter permease, partial [Candidatus Hodarchaeota archaeon]
LYDVQDSRSRVINEVIELSNFADGFVYLDTMNRSSVDQRVNRIASEYFNEHEFRMILTLKFEIEDEEYEGLLIGVDTSISSHINTLLEEDKDEIEEYEYCLNWNFAEFIDADVGDDVSIIYGSTSYRVEIKEVGYTPEFTMVPLHEDVIIPSLDPYPVFFVSLEFLSYNILHSPTVLINQIIYKLKEVEEQDDIKVAIEEEFGISVQNIVPQEEQPFIKTMREDEESDRQMLMIFLVAFIIGSIIVLIVVMHRLIEADLKSVSVFQGLGATKGEILGGYLIFNLLLFSIAFVLGSMVGLALNIPFNIRLADMMKIPFSPGISFTFHNAILIGIGLFVVSSLTTILIIKRSFTMDVQQSLKYETKFLSKTNSLEKLALKFNKNLHPFKKYTIRRVYGKKLFLGLLLIGLTISSCFIFFSFSLSDSIRYSIDKKLNDIERWDAMATTWQYEEEYVLDNNLSTISGIDTYEFGVEDTVLLSKNENDFKDYFKLIAFEENSELHLIKAENGAKLDKRNDIFLSKDILQKYSLHIGSHVFLKTLLLDEAKEFLVVGTVNDMTAVTIYMPLERAQSFLNNSNRINTIYFKIEKDVDEDELIQHIQDLPIMKDVVLKKSIKEDLESAIEITQGVIRVLALIFLLFGLAIVGVIVKNLVDYRIEDYANMKALGLRDSEIKKSIFKELLIYFAISIPLGLLLGFLIMVSIFKMYSSLMPGLFVYVYPMSYVYFGVCMSIMIVVVLYFQFRKLKHMNIAEITKMKTFG